MPPESDTDVRHLTIAEYADLQEPDDVRSELVGGVLVREPRPGFGHGQVISALDHALHGFVKEHALGVVLVDVGVVLSRDPPTVRGPDLLFLAADRIPEPRPEGFLEIAPDLAVEVVSPSNRAGEIQEKVTEYLDGGVRMVWVLDPASRTGTVYRSRDDIRLLTAEDELDGGEVVPGFRMRLGDVLPEG